jgi:hypothetical protein
MLGMTFKKKRVELTMRPAHVREEDTTAEAVATVDAVAEGSNPLGGSIELMELAAMDEVSDVEIDVANSVKFVERLNAIVAYKSRYYDDHILAYKKSTTPRRRLGKLVLQLSWESEKEITSSGFARNYPALKTSHHELIAATFWAYS